MPSPLGHGLAGLTVHLLSAGREELADVRRIAVLAGAAIIPDLDLALRLVDGQNHHQQETHSFGAAVLAGLAFWVVQRVARGRSSPREAVWVALAWLSHPLLDFFGEDTHPPIGLMALWPLSDGFYHFAQPIFMSIGRSPSWEMVRHNAVAVAWEILVLAPLAFAAWRGRRGSAGLG